MTLLQCEAHELGSLLAVLGLVADVPTRRAAQLLLDAKLLR